LVSCIINEQLGLTDDDDEQSALSLTNSPVAASEITSSLSGVLDKKLTAFGTELSALISRTATTKEFASLIGDQGVLAQLSNSLTAIESRLSAIDDTLRTLTKGNVDENIDEANASSSSYDNSVVVGSKVQRK
jgi:hypothetical protein